MATALRDGHFRQALKSGLAAWQGPVQLRPPAQQAPLHRWDCPGHKVHEADFFESTGQRSGVFESGGQRGDSLTPSSSSINAGCPASRGGGTTGTRYSAGQFLFCTMASQDAGFVRKIPGRVSEKAGG